MISLPASAPWRSRLCGSLFGKAVYAEPVQQQLGPLTDGGVVERKSEAVGAFFEDVDFGRHSHLTQREIVMDSILGGNGCIGIRLEEECGRSLLRYGQISGEAAGQIGGRTLAEQVGF